MQEEEEEEEDEEKEREKENVCKKKGIFVSAEAWQHFVLLLPSPSPPAMFSVCLSPPPPPPPPPQVGTELCVLPPLGGGSARIRSGGRQQWS